MPNLAKLAAKGNATYGIDATPLKGNATYGVDATPLKGNATYDVNATPTKGDSTYGSNATPLKYGVNATYGIDATPTMKQLHKSTTVEEQRIGPASVGGSTRDDQLEHSYDESYRASRSTSLPNGIDDSVEVNSLIYSHCEESGNVAQGRVVSVGNNISRVGGDASASSSISSVTEADHPSVSSSSSNSSTRLSPGASLTPSPGVGDDGDDSFLPPNISAISKAILSASSDSPTDLGRMIIQLSQQAEQAKKVRRLLLFCSNVACWACFPVPLVTILVPRDAHMAIVVYISRLLNIVSFFYISYICILRCFSFFIHLITAS